MPARRSYAGDPLLTVSEVAATMRVSNMTVYRLIKSGQLAALRVHEGLAVAAEGHAGLDAGAALAARNHGHRSTVGEPNCPQSVVIKQEAHLHIDVLGLEAVRGKQEGKLTGSTFPGESWQGAWWRRLRGGRGGWDQRWSLASGQQFPD